MEDDGEFRSQASPVDSDSSSPPAGRITVTVASAGPPSTSSLQDSNALALALPMKSSGGGRSRGNGSNGRSGGGGGREDSWSEGATAVLIDAWGQKYLELSKGNLKQNHWKEVAEIVSSRDDYGKTPKTDIQCKNRIDTVKKKYKQEKAKIVSGDGPSRWVFFDKLDRLIGSTAKIPTASPGGGRLQNIPVGIPTRNPSNLYNQLQKSTKPPLDRLIGATARIPSASLGGGGSYGDVPTGIPVNCGSNMFGQRGRASPLARQGIVERCSESKRWRFKKRNGLDSDSESETEMSADSADSLPPPPLPKRVKIEKEKVVDEKVDKWKELSLVIKRFGEAYEEVENAKLQQFVEMEKARMNFMKEMELQRMQFFVKTQLEISRLKQQQGRRNGVGDTSSDHHNDENKNNKKNIPRAVNSNNSDGSN